jgi:hypothetical protein
MIGAGALFLLLELIARLLALLPNWFTAQSLWIVPVTALLFALAMWRRILPKDTARLVDERTGSKELFLTAAMIDRSPGEFQPIVLQQAEERAASLQPAKVLPFAWQRGARDVAGVALVLAAAVIFLPQLDPFKKEEARQKIAKEAERLREMKKITALRAEQIAATPKTDQVEKSLAALDETLKAMKREEKEANLKRLGEHQRELGEMWRKVNNELPRENFERAAQSFGQADSKKMREMREELKKGELTIAKKEFEEMRKEMERLASMPDSAEKRAMQEQLQQRMNAMADALKQQCNSPGVNAALQRAMQQLDLAKLGQLSQEALDAAKDSLNLSEEELQELAQSMRDAQSLEQALKNLQMAKKLAGMCELDGEACKNCNGMGDYAALFAKLGLKTSDQVGPGMGPGGNPGAGGIAPEDDSLKTAFKPEKEQSKFAGGKTLMQWQANEVGETGARAEDYRAAVRDVKQRVSEAIAAEQVPPGYHEAIKKYFDSLPEK